MNTVIWIVAVLLLAAVGVTITRIVKGPRILDRMVASDVLLSIIIFVIGFEAAINRHSTTLPIMLVLAALGFVGSVSVARFTSRENSRTEPKSTLTMTKRHPRPGKVLDERAIELQIRNGPTRTGEES